MLPTDFQRSAVCKRYFVRLYRPLRMDSENLGGCTISADNVVSWAYQIHSTPSTGHADQGIINLGFTLTCLQRHHLNDGIPVRELHSVIENVL